MSTLSPALPSPPSRAIVAIVLAGMVAGTCDLIFAFSFHGFLSHVGPVRILQVIASGWLGTDSFNDGAASATLGFVSHYGILIGAASLFYLASRRLPWMLRHAYLCGAAFGVCIYLTMNYVIVPLSNVPHLKSSTLGFIADFSMHVLVIGPAIALTLRRFAPTSPSR